MNEKKLRDILEKHAKWLNKEEGGERADLTGKDLSGMDLSDANLMRSVLEKVNLANADLRSANLKAADLSDANLTGANLTGANLLGVDLVGTNLTDANLTDACLKDACLVCANLTGAKLMNADLRDADLVNADITDVDLNGAKLQGILRHKLSEQLSDDLKFKKKDERLAVLVPVFAFLVPLIFMFAILLFTDIRGRMFTLLNGAVLCVCMLGSCGLYFHWWKKNMMHSSKNEKDIISVDPKGELKNCLILNMPDSIKTCRPWDKLKLCSCGSKVAPFLMYEKNELYTGDKGRENVFAICSTCGRHTEISDVSTVIDNWNNDKLKEE